MVCIIILQRLFLIPGGQYISEFGAIEPFDYASTDISLIKEDVLRTSTH